MKDNGFELRREKTCLILFNNGENAKSLPQIKLDSQLLHYKQNTMFLGVYITTKLNWRLHIENLIKTTEFKLFEARSSRFDSPEVPPRWQTLEKVMSRMLFIGGDASYFALGPCGVHGLQ